MDIMEKDILMTILFEKSTGKFLKPWLLVHALYYNFYQGHGINESDFILEFAWSSHANERLVPDSFKRLFDTINVSIPLPHTSTLFEARLITNFDIHGKNITINNLKVTYKFIFRRTFEPKFDYYRGAPYLEESPFVIESLLFCRR